ncbi:MAG TPA: 50S ribosomal protein L15, partial [Pyrodictium sp.]|nr:50S ribosomal protein L15 [Pyrodictium sp.]
TMGWGRIGQHRGSGSRGGFGAAGMHKHMWTWVVKYAPTWFGKLGFNRPLTYEVKVNEINVGELAEKLDVWLREGKASEEGGRIVVNLASLGYNKLLGRGSITKPVKVIVPAASGSAIRKIEAAGGEVVVLNNEEN